MDYTDADIELFRQIAEGEVTRRPIMKDRERAMYKPLYKHPLEPSERRNNHEQLLKRIMSVPFERQVMACITLGDAWCLEECYLRGASVCFTDRCGVTPLHLAAQLDRFDCCMVLVHIKVGVNINSTSLDGMTPLGMALATNALTTARYLAGIGAKTSVPEKSERYTVASTVLERKSVSKPSVASTALADHCGLPHHHLLS